MQLTVFKSAMFRPKLLGHQLELTVLPMHGFVGNAERMSKKYVAFDQNEARRLYLASNSNACPYVGLPTDDSTPWRYAREELRQDDDDSEGWPTHADYHASIYVCSACGARAESIQRKVAFHPTSGRPIDEVTVSNGLGFDPSRGVFTLSDAPGMLTLVVSGPRTPNSGYAQKHFANLQFVYAGTGSFASEEYCSSVEMMVLV